MTDPTHHDPWLRALAYLHPLWMTVGLGMAVLALRSGLALRRGRRARRPPPPGARARHLRRAKTAVAMLLAGFLAGPVSAVWLRGFEPFASFHGAAGALAAGLLVATAWLGRGLEVRGARHFDAHAFAAGLALLFAALAAVAGMILLP